MKSEIFKVNLEEMEAKWHILYTKEGAEYKVFQHLQFKKIECFLPVTTSGCDNAFRRSVERRPLFPAKVFVKTTASELVKLKQISGVINVVFWLDQPAVIPELEVAAIKKFVKEHPSVSLQKMPINLKSTSSEVTAYQVRKEEMTGNEEGDTYKIHLPFLGHLLVAEVEKPKLKVIASKPVSKGLIAQYKGI